MPERQRIPLPIGGGLDRATGLMVQAPGTIVDLRNLLVKEGKAQLRGGVAEAVEVTMDGGGVADDIVFLGAHRAALLNVLVAHRTASTEPVQVFRTATNGLNPTFVDGWPAPSGTASPDPPIIHGVEVYERFFLAHDEADITARRPTQVLTSSGTLSTLQADLDGGGSANVLFRGVFRYLSYLGGWGFGSDSDKDRGEIVRFSLPDDATVFRKEHLFYCGARGEPVIACAPGSNRVVVLKEREAHVITGYDRTSFAVHQIDPRFGVAGSRLWAVHEDSVYAWTIEGPRVFGPGGGASEDLAIPLDLDGVEPADLIASGAAERGWAEYLQQTKVMLFAFPNRDEGVTRAYALSLRDPNRPRWSYLEVGRALWCCGRVYAVTGNIGAPIGFPDNVALAFTGLTGAISWDNNGAVGDETVEVWLQAGSGAFTLVREVMVSGSSQSTSIGEADGVAANTTYTVALRYRRGTAYATDYQNPVTSGWTGTAVTDSTASDTTDATPTVPSAFAFVSCSEAAVGGKNYLSIDVQWTNGASAPATTEILESSDGGATRAVIFALPLATTSKTLGPYLITPSAPDRLFYVRHVLSGLPSAQVALDANPIQPSAGCAL